MTRPAALAVTMLLCGCVGPSDSASISVDHTPNPGADLRLNQARGSPRLGGAHAVPFLFVERTTWRHTIWVPYPPRADATTTYGAAEVQVIEAISAVNVRRVSAVGGTVSVERGSVVVDLMLGDGPFSGNGVYPLSR